jgi:hypothetical protein
MSVQKETIAIIVSLIAFSYILACTGASETLYVSTGQEITRNTDLTSGEIIKGALTATGVIAIDFTITDPTNNMQLQYGNTFKTTFFYGSL